jgi:dsRNA-specific ribonuclease|tara:strand:- start:225 stop:512 length:288 start_codon:yes stop_codon:yes gene_type:complete
MQPSSKGRDIFVSPSLSQNLELDGNVVHTSAESQLLNNVDLMMEALTAPNANRNYDYERLEFYGDSVISFLVILELFLTKDYEYKEGPLDFYRIK